MLQGWMVGLSGRCGLINFVRGYTNPNLIFGFGNGKKGNGVLVGPTGRGASGQGKEGTPGTMGEKKPALWLPSGRWAFRGWEHSLRKLLPWGDAHPPSPLSVLRGRLDVPTTHCSAPRWAAARCPSCSAGAFLNDRRGLQAVHSAG